MCCDDGQEKATITKIGEIVNITERLLAGNTVTAGDDWMAQVSAIHAIAYQLYRDHSGVPVTQESPAQPEENPSGQAIPEKIACLRQVAQNPESVEKYKAGWRLEHCRRISKYTGREAIYLQFRRGTGQNRESIYAGTLKSAKQ